MAHADRGDSRRGVEGRIPVTAVSRRGVERPVLEIANVMGVSRNVGIVHVLRASESRGMKTPACGSGTRAVQSSVVREVVRFIALVER
jgi:hypothetical protein